MKQDDTFQGTNFEKIHKNTPTHWAVRCSKCDTKIGYSKYEIKVPVTCLECY